MSTSNTLKQRVLRVLKAQKKTPLSPRELAKKVGVRKDKRNELRQVLAELQADHTILERSGKVVLTQNLGLVRALIVKVTGTFGFATPDGEGKQDVFIPGRKLSGAMPGDRVLLKVRSSTGRLPEGEVYQVLEQANPSFSGVLEILPDGFARVVPDKLVKFPLAIAPKDLAGAQEGDKVLCEIAQRGKDHRDHRARVLEVFGNADNAAACCRAILRANAIVEEFPPEVQEQAAALAASDGIHPKELQKRMDLRDEPVFTIDSADSKDLDDAISLRRQPEGWELGVHIADVSYYVTHETPLDKEAFVRGTSVYYADSVIPMLPPELSNGICSLNPGEDRLAFSVLIQLDSTGKMTAYRFEKTVIRSRVKGVYSEVNALLGGSKDQALLQKYGDLVQTLHEMKALADTLARRRVERGSVQLETTESKVILDSAGRCIDVVPRERGIGEDIIEEFMLAANQAAATCALERKLPFIFRVHDNPAPDKVTQLWDLLERLDVRVRRPRGGVTPQQLTQVLDKVEGTPMDRAVNTMVLRSMAKAKYSERCTGHFGLAIHNYTHFTSPIRRYPDLAIHRILSAWVTGMKKPRIERRFEKFVGEAAFHSSQREVASMTAERDCESSYKAECMRGHIGQEMDGFIASVTPFGVYVQLPNTVEGLVPLAGFPDGEWTNEENLSFVERRTGKQLTLGTPVRVQVVGADISAGTVEFKIVSH